jgi:arsenate reductase
VKILFICTHNRCRSIIAEAVANHVGKGQLEARSAGSAPSGNVHPLSLQYLGEAGLDTTGLSSESWDEHEGWQPDVVITVCDQAANEPCPVWFGKALQVHWGLTDPSRIDGSEEEIATAFRNTIALLQSRLQRLRAANPDTLDKDTLTTVLNELGES